MPIVFRPRPIVPSITINFLEVFTQNMLYKCYTFPSVNYQTWSGEQGRFIQKYPDIPYPAHHR